MTNKLAIDKGLIEAAREIGKHKTNIEAVNEALRVYVERHRPSRIIELFGQIDYDPEHDHKKQRNVS